MMKQETDRADIVKVDNVSRHFSTGGLFSIGKAAQVHAVNGVTLMIKEGNTQGLVGESGCGKTTLGRIIVGLDKPTKGEIVFRGEKLSTLPYSERRKKLRKLQMIFQDPYSSLNPSFTIGDVLWEGYRHRPGANSLSSRERREQLEQLSQTAGLPANMINLYPHQLSGGQRQRVNIARALSVNPVCIVADEPTSALDVSVQAQILNLFIDLQQSFGLTYLFISHNLAVIQYICDRVAVMYLGVIVEEAHVERIFNSPLHPYTEALLDAVPSLHVKMSTERPILEGDLPSPMDPPSGCRFHPRCPAMMKHCKHIEPQLQEHKLGQWVACHLYGDSDLTENDVISHKGTIVKK